MLEALPRTARRGLTIILLCLFLAGCAALSPRPRQALPPLRLAPKALGYELALQQQLRFHFGPHTRTLDAMLEVDAHEVRLLVQAMGQAGVRVLWDGQTLQQQRADWLPASVRAERVLDDLQFSLWPVAAIRAALPASWSVRESAGHRELVRDGKVWLAVTRVAPDRMQLVNHAENYSVEIASIASDAAASEQP